MWFGNSFIFSINLLDSVRQTLERLFTSNIPLSGSNKFIKKKKKNIWLVVFFLSNGMLSLLRKCLLTIYINATVLKRSATFFVDCTLCWNIHWKNCLFSRVKSLTALVSICLITMHSKENFPTLCFVVF